MSYDRLMVPSGGLALASLVAFVLVMLAPARARAAELEPRTSRAYDEYADSARRAFVDRASRAPDVASKRDAPIPLVPAAKTASSACRVAWCITGKAALLSAARIYVRQWTPRAITPRTRPSITPSHPHASWKSMEKGRACSCGCTNLPGG